MLVVILKTVGYLHIAAGAGVAIYLALRTPHLPLAAALALGSLLRGGYGSLLFLAAAEILDRVSD